MQFYLNILPKLHHRNWWKSRIILPC